MNIMINNMAVNAPKPANAPDIDVSILYQPWEDLDIDITALIERVIGTAMTRAELPKAAKNKRVELSIALVSDESIKLLNSEFRGKDKPTNVLSFEFEDYDTLPPDAEYPLGDIVMAYETIKRETEEQNKKLTDHCAHMVLHGFLHLLGYDHIKDDEAEIMEAKEIEILKEIGIENPYL